MAITCLYLLVDDICAICDLLMFFYFMAGTKVELQTQITKLQTVSRSHDMEINIEKQAR